ncbi:class I SAM-dependent methyltransferase [Prosthecobacter vanneervenii]|uniref:Chemotaxis methyl-accepting protein methylase n=1 Tax=Prosthecobacter vanneervenii TaxID=48466 RepID=A0A7W8DM79_9BACT|nr:class I SAM-dependent methyltransferase [Prosthecobacter vanneervenii]MBB5034790.1 chemotaxis methyl-accepting protein methylase [Prosthecobacter vanneervenii]
MNPLFQSQKLPLQTANTIEEDMSKLKSLLHDSLSPHLPAGQKDMRILNLACGRCDEAETLIQVGSDLTQGGAVEMIGADIRIREIRQARETHRNLPAQFLIEDATKIDQHKELGDDFNMVFLRHQNFWHGQELWKKIFDQGIAKLRPDGMLVITSYFDVEHRLALRALESLGMEVVSNKRNKESRSLKDAPGKSVDRWVAVLRQRQA